MYGRAPPDEDREVTWRSVTAGFVLVAAIFALQVAISHPVGTGVVVAIGVGLYAARGVLRRTTYERTLQFCRAGFCLRLELSVG